MEGRKLGFRTVTNDNFTEAELKRGAEAVVSLGAVQKTVEEAPELDGLRYRALRDKVVYVEQNYPFLISESAIKEALKETSNLNNREIIRLVNSIDTNTLEDTKAPFYRALTFRLRTPSTYE